MSINVIYVGYIFVFVKVTFFKFFCLQNLRSFHSFLYLVKKSKKKKIITLWVYVELSYILL